MPDIPNFSVQNNFPVASVIQAAQRKGELDNQTTLAQSQMLNNSLEAIGGVGKSLMDTKKRVAQSLALGRQFDVPDDVSKMMTPEQILHVGTIKKGLVDMNMLLNMRYPGSGGTSSQVPAMPATTPTQPGASLQSTPTNVPMALSPKPEAILASNSPTIPMPAHTEPAAAMPFGGASAMPTPSPVPVPIQAPPPRMVNAATISAAAKMGLFKPADETFMTPQQALEKGSAPRGSVKIVNPQTGQVSDFKQQSEQDKLESQAMNRVSGIRGDASLKRVEDQRDAAIQAFNTAAQIKSENRAPNQIEYYDLLGQMWKARTGASPTDQAIRDLDAKTFKGDIGKAFQYFSGEPAPRTTRAVMQSIQNFADNTGKQADKMHDGYMSTHLIKPKGLSDDRWKPILETNRGLSFSDATKGARQTASSNAPAGATVTPKGTTYTVNP